MGRADGGEMVRGWWREMEGCERQEMARDHWARRWRESLGDCGRLWEIMHLSPEDGVVHSGFGEEGLKLRVEIVGGV